MHVDVPKLPMESMKDLAKHYVMIVLGILTALGLEAWIEHAHHQHAAETAGAQIEAEIRENRTAIDVAIAEDTKREKALAQLREILIDDIKSNTPSAQVIQHVLKIAPDGPYLDWRWPMLQHEAWDVAVANQSAGWIASDKLHRYAKVYSIQNARVALMEVGLRWVLDGPRMIDVEMDLQTGKAQPDQVLYTVNQMWAVTEESVQNLTGLARSIDDTMAGKASSH
jgi:hypothetical protein